MNQNGSTKAIFFASFMTLIAAGMGFGVRAAILTDWGEQFGFTKQALGEITGSGLVGFGITIIVFSLFADAIGYKPLMLGAFLLHAISAVVMLSANIVYDAAGQEATYWTLYAGNFTFALANGMCEAVINPLVATLYPKQKTHYLNILHAGWPGGLIIGGIIGYLFCGGEAVIMRLDWKVTMGLFLVPTLIYGFITVKESFPISEAKAAGVKFGEMFAQFFAPLLLFLLFLHACVGYVELGTDSWITNIMETQYAKNAFLLFIYTSAIMFVLRFFAGPIVEKINPVGLLFAGAVLGAVGLYFLGSVDNNLSLIVVAATIYGLGKTFFWPTMLGVVGERFPKGGALVMGAMGGVGMLSAGLLGGPGIGYKQDYAASHYLEQKDEQVYERYKSDKEKGFLFFPEISGIDGQKLAVVKDSSKALENDLKRLEESGKEANPELVQLKEWWDTTGKPHAKHDKSLVVEAEIKGGQQALRWTAIVPLTMAVGYLLILLYFKAKGGYKQEVLHGAEPEGEHYTGGVEGPVE